MRAADAALLDGTPLLTCAALAGYRAHAVASFPNECFGVVLGDGSYLALDNVSPEPTISAYPEKGIIPALLAADDLRAVAHSHPNGLDCPSEMDMRSQMEIEVPFVLCATDGQATTEPFAWGDQLLDKRPLVGRGFRHAVDDCYAMVRAEFRLERGVHLPDYPRNWEWWQTSTGGEKDLYARYFRHAGFEPISPAEVVPGDCWLAAIRSDVPNHAGVYLDAGLCLHHASGGRAYDPARLSKREPIAKWLPYVTQWVRR